MADLPLNGVRILDFSRVLAGPFCTMLLADLGADVVKVENPNSGDETRAWGPPWATGTDDPQSAYYLSINRNKRSITLDLKSDVGKATAQRLAQKAHVIVENFKPGGMAAFGLDYATLQAENPALVYCSISGFGQTGPFAQRPGYDYIIQAMSGLMAITGETEGEPQKVGVAVSDVFTGLFAANAIQAALRYAEQTGHGQHIDMALYDSQLAALVNIASNSLVGGQTPPRMGNQHPNIVPYQTFNAADQPFVLAVGNDGQFRRLCEGVINQPALADDPRYATNPARVSNRGALIDHLQGIFHTKPAEKWVNACLDHGIPAGKIQTVDAALHDPHSQAREIVQTITLANGAQVPLVASPMRMNRTPPSIRRAPPTLGEHNHLIETLWD